MIEATLTANTENAYEVKLTESDLGIAAGQSVIFYHDSICYGGAVIDSVNSMSGSLGRIVNIAETGSPLIDSLVAIVRMDARLLIAETLDSVDVIRLAAMSDVDREIGIILEALQGERIGVMATIDTLTQARIAQSVSAVRSLMWIAILLGIVVLVAPFVLGLVVGRAVSKNRPVATTV